MQLVRILRWSIKSHRRIRTEMSIFNTPLGMNLTNSDPLVVSPFVIHYDHGEGFPPPGSFFMITETGIFMLDEDGIELMITE